VDSRPIADYALISDCRTAALVSTIGSIDWLCLPDFDAQSVFGRLLDPNAGHWSISVRGPVTTSRRYLRESMVLETTFVTEAGAAVLTDTMALGEQEREHDLGRNAPHCVLRSIECSSGQVQIDFEYVPRPEYGVIHPLLAAAEGGVQSRGGASSFFLSSPIDLPITQSRICVSFALMAGEKYCFAMQCGSILQMAYAWTQKDISLRIADTVEAWCSWSRIHQNYQGPWRDLVAHSGRILQALTYHPTGAIVAAPTTSLPEVIGGDRNWDYRFTWIRDASFTLDALWVAACPDEVHRFFDFIAEAALTQVRQGFDLQIMFGIRGEHDLSERVLPQLKGWRNSSPVRIGNGAWTQRQLDVYGELMGAVFTLKEHLTGLDQVTREFLVAVVETAAQRWTQKDQGIWEVRGEPRHFLYSKLMCWVALDRGIRLAGLLGAEQKVPEWIKFRQEMSDAIISRGWSTKAKAFAQSFESDDLDASALMIPIVGFLPGDDPRVQSTIDAIVYRLTDQHGLVFRYLVADGLTGKEGSFLLCTFWLSQAQALAGRLEQAKDTFAKAAGFANDVGLLAEEVLPETRELLGNFPQAFSHIGLVNAAWAISQLEESTIAQGRSESSNL
jgi:alpha,alpha-trehalase